MKCIFCLSCPVPLEFSVINFAWPLFLWLCVCVACSGIACN